VLCSVGGVTVSATLVADDDEKGADVEGPGVLQYAPAVPAMAPPELWTP
jgi:hypothetical protein